MLRRAALGFGLLCLLASCGGSNIGAPKYALDQCRQVALIDEASGRFVSGAEDLALDTKNQRLIISAYDRRAVEAAAKKRNSDIPHGGLYEVVLTDLFREEEISVSSLIDPETVAGGLRPHGIDIDPRTNEIVFINRSYEDSGKRRVMIPRLLRLKENNVVDGGNIHCAANDISIGASQSLYSFDHRACGFQAAIEDIFGQAKSGLKIYEGDVVADDIRFANGVGHSGEMIVLAATRDKSLYQYNNDDGTYIRSGRTRLPGAPDNLSMSDDGTIIVALHSSLFRLALNRKLGIGRAPSRVVSVDPENDTVKLLFEDKKAQLFSAATIGIETQGGLVAGSVTDSGLLVCKATT